MVLTKKNYLNNFLRIFEKLLVVITSQQNGWKPCFLQYCWVRKHLAIPFNVENKALIANYRNPKKAFRLIILFIISTYQYQFLEGGHSLRTYAKSSEKLTFLTLWYAHVRVSGLEMLVFRKILRTYLTDDLRSYLEQSKDIIPCHTYLLCG